MILFQYLPPPPPPFLAMVTVKSGLLSLPPLSPPLPDEVLAAAGRSLLFCLSGLSLKSALWMAPISGGGRRWGSNEELLDTRNALPAELRKRTLK